MICALVLAGLMHNLMGRKNQTFDGVILFAHNRYEFYPDAKDCSPKGTSYLLLPNQRFHDIIVASTSDAQNSESAFGTNWQAKLNGNLSHIGWYRDGRNYWRELSVNYVIDALEMNCVNSQLPPVVHKAVNVTVDWNTELAKAKAGIEKNPKSASWHSQAAADYDALGDFKNAVKEIKLACALDESNPNNYYLLYFLYKKKRMYSEARQVLLDALEKDPMNPLGVFEFASILESEGHWTDSLHEYEVAKHLVAGVKEPAYVDFRGNVYEIGGVQREIDTAIERVSKHNESSRPKR